MNLVDQAKLIVESINTNDVSGFAKTQVWSNPNGSLIVTIKGRHVKHHLGIDENGNAINTKNASCSFSEQTMINASFPIRDASGEVNLKGYKVTIVDSTGTLYKYKVEQWFPDETMGMVVCILTAYE